MLYNNALHLTKNAARFWQVSLNVLLSNKDKHERYKLLG